MTKYKRCAQCGCVLPEDSFKIKYVSKKDGRVSRNRFCRACEYDTRNYNRLINSEKLTADEQCDLTDYVEVFAALEKRGYSTPLSRNATASVSTAHKSIRDRLSDVLSNEDTAPVNVNPTPVLLTAQLPMSTNELPADLRKWLEHTAGDELFVQWRDVNLFTTDYLNNVVYPALKAAYRPEVGWDNDKMVPIYDDTYKGILNQISDLFWAYEDWCFANASGESEDRYD